MAPCGELPGRAQPGCCDRGQREGGCFRCVIKVGLSEGAQLPGLKDKREIDADEEGGSEGSRGRRKGVLSEDVKDQWGPRTENKM